METNIQVPPKSWRTPINIISPSMFHPNRVIHGNDDVAFEEDFEIQKPLEVLIRPVSS